MALGVTDTTTVHVPFLVPFTFDPVTLQFFFVEVFTVIDTFEVEANETSFEAKTFFAEIVFLTLTVATSRVIVKV